MGVYGGFCVDVECPGCGGRRMMTKFDLCRCSTRCLATMCAINWSASWVRFLPLYIRAKARDCSMSSGLASSMAWMLSQEQTKNKRRVEELA